MIFFVNFFIDLIQIIKKKKKLFASTRGEGVCENFSKLLDKKKGKKKFQKEKKIGKLMALKPKNVMNENANFPENTKTFDNFLLVIMSDC